MFQEAASGAKLDRIERRKVMALAQRREIDAVLVTELSRWGRSTLDLLHTLKQLETCRVSVIAMNGLTFDLTTPHGRMLATIIAGIAEFERELIRERVRSGLAAAKRAESASGAGPVRYDAQLPRCSHSWARATAIGGSAANWGRARTPSRTSSNAHGSPPGNHAGRTEKVGLYGRNRP